MQKDDKPRYKIIMVGEASVGKTSILRKFTENIFEPDIMNTIGIDFSQKDILVPFESAKKQVKLQIWDTAGQERFHSITRSYYRGSDAIILVFSLVDERSIDYITKWLSNIDEEVGSDKILLVLVGNKFDKVVGGNVKDVESKVLEINTLRKSGGKDDIVFFKTSAKTGLNIDEVFEYTGKKLLSSKIKVEDNKKRRILQDAGFKREGCC
ncbi:small GTP-binding protein domain [Edhazardia aedis USNM 41457]|uniref:Small GTP-binding protein domain n=1 Tax=Edhazardia aedis (strain USNM 41457) TaxID=1003232 RepID=J9D6U6_EDHAE|nr:small GTP-binding protein domain [Edhazardia aedis USNM 41457]|eukprot:EJW03244.1 small GTP-binding protein domain [Edhazardia aedis USNM 41457]